MGRGTGSGTSTDVLYGDHRRRQVLQSDHQQDLQQLQLIQLVDAEQVMAGEERMAGQGGYIPEDFDHVLEAALIASGLGRYGEFDNWPRSLLRYAKAYGHPLRMSSPDPALFRVDPETAGVIEETVDRLKEQFLAAQGN